MTGLYRLYSASGVLLYVGIADNIPSRLKQHSKDKPWWPEVTSTAFQQFATRAEAEAAEKAAIQTERPVHNVVHNRAAKPAATFAERHINWTCELCNEPIDLAAGKEPGYLQITSTEARRWHIEHQDWQQKYPDGFKTPASSGERRPLRAVRAVQVFLDRPKPMHWEHVCKPCDYARNAAREAEGLNPDGGHYWIDLARVKTPGNFLEWTAHVMAKSWVAKHSDWLDLTAKVAGWLGSKGC
mgnify:CR=1 FL=1